MRKGYIFTVDAVLALMVLTIGFLLIFPPVGKKPQETQTFTASTEILERMTASPISEFNDAQIKTIVENTDLVPNPRASPAEVVTNLQVKAFELANAVPPDAVKAEYFTTNARDIAGRYLDAFMKKRNLKYRFWIEDPITNPPTRLKVMNNYLYDSAPGASSEDSESLIAQKRIIYYDDGVNVKGPYIIVLQVWK